MKDSLPNVAGNERNTLYILGNGFDLAHGILSKYKHFFCWLNLNGYEDYAFLLQQTFSKLENINDCIWSNFESALEYYDSHDLYKRNIVLPEDTWNDGAWDSNIEEGTGKVSKMVNEIPELMKAWVKQINTNKSPRFNLSPNSKYLTFNYTKTLEDVYHIPFDNICYIHENVDSDSKLIIGHDSPRSTNNLPAKSDEEERAQIKIVEIMNRLVKPKRQQIEKNSLFFNSLQDITTVIEIGHSMALVDLMYFEKVRKSVAKDAHWHFSCYSEEDKTKMNIFVRPAHLLPQRLEFDTFNL